MTFSNLENKSQTQKIISIEQDRPNRSKSIKSYSNQEIDAINKEYDLQYQKTK